MLESGTDPESYITEYTLVYEDKISWLAVKCVPNLRAMESLLVFDATCSQHVPSF